MATEGVELTEVRNLPTGTEIVAPDSGNANGFFFSRLSQVNGPYKFTMPDNPVTPYKLDLVSYSFDPLATASDPIRIEIAFGDSSNQVEVILSAENKARYDNGEIVIVGVSAAWTPSDPVNSTYFVPSFILRADVESSIVKTETSISRINAVQADGTPDTSKYLTPVVGSTMTAANPTYDEFNRAIAFGPARRQDANSSLTGATILRFNNTLNISTFLMIFKAKSALTQGINFLGGPVRGLRMLNGSTSAGIEIMSSGTTFKSAKFNWNSTTNGSGTIAFSPSYALTNNYMNNTTVTQVPVNTVVTMFVEFSTSVPIATFGGAFFSASMLETEVRGAIDADIYLFMAWPAGVYLSDDYKKYITGWAEHLAFANNWRTSLALAPDHPFFSQPPGGGSAPTVSVSTPTPTLTITGVPAGGIFTIWDDEVADPQDLGTALKVVNPTTGSNITFSTNSGNALMLQFVPNTGQSLNYQEANISFTFPNTSQTLDFSQFLEREDNL